MCKLFGTALDLITLIILAFFYTMLLAKSSDREDIGWLFEINLFFSVFLPTQSVSTTTVPGWATVWEGGTTVSSTCSSCRSPSSPSSSSPLSSRTSFYVSSCEVFCTLPTVLQAVPEPAAVGGCCGTLQCSAPSPSFQLEGSAFERES